jgi:hypothetical protein
MQALAICTRRELCMIRRVALTDMWQIWLERQRRRRSLAAKPPQPGHFEDLRPHHCIPTVVCQVAGAHLDFWKSVYKRTCTGNLDRHVPLFRPAGYKIMRSGLEVLPFEYTALQHYISIRVPMQTSWKLHV